MKLLKTVYVLVLALTLLITMATCGNSGLPAGNGGGTDSVPQSGGSQPTAANATSTTMELKICTVNGSSVRGVGLSETYSEVYDFSCALKQLRGAEAPLPGMVMEIGFDGTVLETWPAQIHADTVTFKEQQTDYFSLYYQILEDILKEDDGLNGDVSKFGFDLTEVSALSESEKQLLAFEFSSAHGVESLQGTLRELMDEGYIDEENLYWEDGLHFTIKEKEVKSGKVIYSVQKWRSGLGAAGYSNTASLDKNGQWVFAEITDMWIS